MFAYKAKDKSGKAIDGTIEGADEHAVAAELRGMGYAILEIKEVAESPQNSEKPLGYFVKYVINPLFAGASIDDLVMFYRQFATMIKAGMSVLQALGSLRKQSANATLHKVADEASLHVQTGGKLSEVLANYPWVFPPLHLHLIRAGETMGGLDTMLERLAGYVESERRLRQRIRMATLYPKILILAVIFIPNIPILVLGSFSDFLRATVGVMIPTLVIVLVLWTLHRLLLQNPRYKYMYDSLLLAIPKIGKMVKMLALTKFYRSFACLYAAGVSPTESLKLAAETSGNMYLSSRLENAIPLLAEGRSLSDALMNTGVIPPMAIDMVSVGVQTGNIDAMLDKAAEYTESEAEVAIHQVLTILPVILLLGFAIYIGVFLARTYGGMYSSITTQ